jgi:hypothetical protein
MEDKGPIYDSKVRKVLELLNFKTRDEAAAALEYKSWRSLDMFMRRKNFVYDAQEGQYVPAQTRLEKLRKAPKTCAPAKVLSVMAAFEVEKADPKVIAQQEGFENHKDMAEYMTSKGYEWNVYRNNYVRVVGKSKEEEVPTEQSADVSTDTTEQELPAGIAEYLPFLHFLYEKREDLYRLLSGVKEDGKIPRYAVPGLVRTKAIYMSDMVGKLTGEFSREKNVTQREIVEAALLEYLQKYGFKHEVEALLKKM